MSVLYRVINCKIHSKRLAQFKKNATRAGLGKLKRVDCVNARNFSDSDFLDMIEQNKLKPNADITPTELAICLSHAKCWNELIKSNADYMVVFEDDCRPYVTFMKTLGKIMASNLDFDILWLYNGNWNQTKKFYKKIKDIDGLEIFRETRAYNASGSAYILTKKWARVLYNNIFPIRMPVDNFMGEIKLKTAKHFTVENRRGKSDPAECFTRSPLMYVPCPGDGNTTQSYNAKTIKDRNLRSSPRRSRRKSPPRRSRSKSRRKSPQRRSRPKSRRKSPPRR